MRYLADQEMDIQIYDTNESANIKSLGDLFSTAGTCIGQSETTTGI